MKTWTPTDTARTRWDDTAASELVTAPVQRPAASPDAAMRLLRQARLTHELPARWTRW